MTSLSDGYSLRIADMLPDDRPRERLERSGPESLTTPELLARCVQHETDHLDGILFIDRLDRAQRKLAMKAIREADWSADSAPVVKVSPHATRGLAL